MPQVFANMPASKQLAAVLQMMNEKVPLMIKSSEELEAFILDVKQIERDRNEVAEFEAEVTEVWTNRKGKLEDLQKELTDKSNVLKEGETALQKAKDELSVEQRKLISDRAKLSQEKLELEGLKKQLLEEAGNEKAALREKQKEVQETLKDLETKKQSLLALLK